MWIKLKESLWLSGFLILFLLVGLNLLISQWSLRFDATKDKLYTLSKGTQAIVSSIKEPITLKFYFSQSAANVPLTYKIFGKRVIELLQEYQRLNPDKLNLELYDPTPDSDEEVWANKFGLKGAQLANGSQFFIGLVGMLGPKEQVIPVLDPRRESYLEYDISELLVRLNQTQLKTLGVISSLPVLGHKATPTQQIQGIGATPAWAAFQELGKVYQLEDIQDAQAFPTNLDLLIVLHPKDLSETTLYQIDQFALTGAPVVILLDPYSRVDPTTQMMTRMGRRSAAGSDLKPLLEHWGIQYKATEILGDLKRAVQVNTSAGTVPFALWQRLDQSAVNPDLVATKELENLILIEPGAFQLSKSSPLHLTPLLQSSDQAGFVPIDLLSYSGPEQINQKIKPTWEKWTLAGILDGPVDSAYQNPPADLPTELQQKKPLLKSVKNARILIINDVDFLHDRFSVDSFSLLGQVIRQPKNDNLGFFINMIDFLGGSTELMGIRSRGTFSRPFTHFDQLEEQASVKYRAAQAKLKQKLQQVQTQIKRLDNSGGKDQGALNKEQLQQVQQYKEVERQTKISLRKIRKLLHQDIETEITWITLINLLSMPLLLLFAGTFVYQKRFSRTRR